ncbi:MAG: hypothetical protein V8R91_20300 [Butyricimonas faecihominis]
MKTGRNTPRSSDDALRISEWNDAYMKAYPQDLKYPVAASLWEMYRLFRFTNRVQ